jgi:hypothetical protein
MSYVNAQGQAVMRVDNWSTLSQGQARNSVRIESQDVFNKGLFILDVEQAPWGSVDWIGSPGVSSLLNNLPRWNDIGVACGLRGGQCTCPS